MRPADGQFDPRLLDARLNRLTPAELQALLADLRADGHLAADAEVLRQACDALNAWAAPVPREGLAERILARVAQGTAAGATPASLKLRPDPQLVAAAERSAQTVIRFGKLRDILAVAAAIVLAVGVGVPGMLHVRDRSLRSACSANLMALGRGLQQYSATFASSLPFAGFGANTSWRPVSDPHMDVVPNRRHAYPLLRLAFVSDSRVFVCPSRQDVPMPQREIAHRSDFLEARNVSYAYFNMAGVRPRVSDHPDLPVFADDNPLFDGGVPLMTRLGLRSEDRTNSVNHGGAGQNIVSVAGHVKWTTLPTVGANGDNIWTLSDVRVYSGREGPRVATDAHLIK